MSLDELRIVGSGNTLNVVGDHDALLTFKPDEPEGFAWTSATANIDAGDTALLVTNLSTSKHLHIVSAYIFSDVHTQILFTTPSFATFTGTAVVGVPLNRGAISVAPATAFADETINGSGNVFARTSTNELTTGQFGQTLELGGKLKLGFRDSIGIDIVAESTAFYAMILGYYH